jgi:hypothetical protein
MRPRIVQNLLIRTIGLVEDNRVRKDNENITE